MLQSSNTTLKFSDATAQDKLVPIDHTDPRHLIAFMIQTRRMCRSKGLIKRDQSELRDIGVHTGISTLTTDRILSIMLSSDSRNGLTASQLEQIDALPAESTPAKQRKKTRHRARVFVGLSIWALTIAIAMQMI
ncbi:MAG: hypothetical protein JJ974_08480 [Phycisphaerales bacterium]|nr:hypothetical protein [Phycisphaerales bacterium]